MSKLGEGSDGRQQEKAGGNGNREDREVLVFVIFTPCSLKYPRASWDVGEMATDVETYENIVGGIFSTKGIDKLSKLNKLSNVNRLPDVQLKSIGAAALNYKNIKLLSKNVLNKNNIDPHQLKMDFLGKKGKISQYDLYKHTDTGEVLIFKKGAQSIEDVIHTGEYID